jgi:hypothetical protein
MTISDILTGGGYPIQMSEALHVRTLLVFTFRKNNELCSAASSATRNGRRKRRQVAFDSSQLPMTLELLNAILSDQK